MKFLKVRKILSECRRLLMVEGIPKAIGKADTLGETQQFVMEFQMPNGERDRVANDVTVGAYYAVGLDLGKVPSRLVERHLGQLKTYKQLEEAGENVSEDELLGAMLYLTAIAYFLEVDTFNEFFSKSAEVTFTRHPSEAMVMQDMKVSYLFWSPFDLDNGGIGIDVDRNIFSPFGIDGDPNKSRVFMQSTGTLGSGLEHGIFEQIYGISAVSTIKVLQIANEEGIPIYQINSTNVDQILPRLQVSEAVKSQIKNSVSSGQVVIIPERDINFIDWNGVGYIVVDPASGAGAYMISGGLAGGRNANNSQNQIMIGTCTLEEFLKSLLIAAAIFGFLDMPLLIALYSIYTSAVYGTVTMGAITFSVMAPPIFIALLVIVWVVLMWLSVIAIKVYNKCK